MYQRFKDSLMIPKNIIQFRNDSLVKVFLYIIFFASLLSTRTVIEVIQFDGLNYAVKEAIGDELQLVDESCGFTSTTVFCEVEEAQLLISDSLFSYYIDSTSAMDADNYEGMYNIVFFDEYMYVNFIGVSIYQIPISVLPDSFTDIDFSNQVSDNELFQTQLLQAVDDLLVENRGIWAPILITMEIISSFLLFMFFILLSTWMMRIRFKPISFRHLFTMTVYSSTALYIILIFNSLYNLSFFLIIILVVVAFRQNNQLSLELFRRLKKKP